MKKQNTENQILFRTQVNYKLTSKCLEKPKGISETIPDQSYTIKEILEKFVVNIPEFLLKNTQYSENEPDLDNYNEEEDLTRMDTLEKYQYIKEKTENYNNLLKSQKTNNKQTKEPEKTEVVSDKSTENQQLTIKTENET